MKRSRNLMVALAILLLFSGCEKFFLYEDQSDNPEAILSAVWTDINEHYSGFLDSSMDWQNVFAAYSSMLSSTTSENELWDVMTQMMEELNDEHVKLFNDQDGIHYISGDEKARQAASLFDLELIAGTYLTEIRAFNNYVLSGKFTQKENVGYIYVAAFLDENPKIIQSALRELRSSSLDALVMDLRGCIGGYDGLAARYAAYFSDGIHHIYNSQYKTGPGKKDFSYPKTCYTEGPEKESFTKPIIVLTDAGTASEAEIFLLNMRAFGNVIHMGDTTAGALSTVGPARFLSNGWRYEYSIERITNPDESSFEKVGIPPAFYSKNTSAIIQAGKDKVIEESLQYLQDNFNI